jgi:hypothetical protein
LFVERKRRIEFDLTREEEEVGENEIVLEINSHKE